MQESGYWIKVVVWRGRFAMFLYVPAITVRPQIVVASILENIHKVCLGNHAKMHAVRQALVRIEQSYGAQSLAAKISSLLGHRREFASRNL